MSPEKTTFRFRRGTAKPLTFEVVWYDGTIIDEMAVPATSRYSSRLKVEDRRAAGLSQRRACKARHLRNYLNAVIAGSGSPNRIVTQSSPWFSTEGSTVIATGSRPSSSIISNGLRWWPS
jgi:hypothetical protein